MSELGELPEELKHWAASAVAELRAAGWKGEELRCVEYTELPEGGADVVFEWDNDEPPAS